MFEWDTKSLLILSQQEPLRIRQFLVLAMVEAVKRHMRALPLTASIPMLMRFLGLDPEQWSFWTLSRRAGEQVGGSGEIQEQIELLLCGGTG